MSVLRALILVSVCCALSTGLMAQQRPSRAPFERTAAATRVDRQPKLDGTLDDPLWSQAEPITDFRQREPNEGTPASEKTEVRVLYTRTEIIFGILCRDAAPGAIVATQLRRDVTQELDDYFEIIIDARHDRRNAYVFQVNPLGTQRDALITDEQATENQDGDPGWDGVWKSDAQRTAHGWTATVAIPFSTLNFMKSENVVWGLNFKRFIRHKNEEDLWSGWRRTYGANKISQAGELTGITDIGNGRLFVVKPYLLGGFQHYPPNATAPGFHPGTSPELNAGLDVKLGIRSNIVANFTGNTDFADTDVDVQQFNLSPYKLFYPEKRQFFLENAGVFAFPIGGSEDQLFFSRDIGIDPITGQEVPINGGAKITGSAAGFEFGAMEVDTRSSGPNPFANYAVLRVKRSLGTSGSYIGAIGIDKRSGDPTASFNESGGIDTRLVFFRDLVLSGFAATTRSPGFASGQSDAGVSLSYRSNWFDFEADHRKIGPNFNPQVGFLERPDCVCDFVDADFKVRPKFAGLREINFESFIAHDPDTQGNVMSQEWQATFRAEFQNGSYTDDDIVDAFAQRLTEPFNIYKNIYLPIGVYNWTRHQFTYGSALDRRFTWRLFERFGGYYNGRLNEARVRATYRSSERLSFTFSEQWNRFRLPVMNGDFDVIFGALETDYAFSRFLALSTVLQMNTANAQGASANVRLRWNYRPDSDLYVIYTAGQQFASLTAANPAQYFQHRFVLKYTYSFRP